MGFLGGCVPMSFQCFQNSRFFEPHDWIAVTIFSRVIVKTVEAPSVAILLTIMLMVEKLSVSMVVEMNHMMYIAARSLDSELEMGKRKQ